MIRRVLFFMLLVVVGAGGFSTPASVMSQDVSSGVTVHVVQRGENLYRIALRYGLTVAEIAQYNGIVDPTNIQVGQRLLIPLANHAAPPLPTTHVVQPGETLRSIAELYGLTVEQLVALNTITNADKIYVGQVLNLVPVQPAAAPAAVPIETSPVMPPESQALIYVVEPGDTLFKIATRFGLTVNDLATANEISDPTVIYAGQKLLIPGVEPPQIAVDLPPKVTSFTMSPLILVEGETGEFRLTTAVPMTITGQFLGRDVRDATPDGGLTHIILVGVPVFTEAGTYPFQIVLVDSSSQQIPLDISVQVLAGGYGNENITLLAGRDNLLDPSLDADEKAFIEGIMSGFTPVRYFDGPMGLPAAASITSPFGRKRSYNGGPRTFFHSGTDFAGAPGTPVMAAAPGVVVFAGSLNVRGKATIIDHGWGVYTGYWHQTEQFVSVGDTVTVGQVIGTIGATGRVTGPHLHWEVWVNGVPVNPMQWVKQSFF